MPPTTSQEESVIANAIINIQMPESFFMSQIFLYPCKSFAAYKKLVVNRQQPSCFNYSPLTTYFAMCDGIQLTPSV